MFILGKSLVLNLVGIQSCLDLCVGWGKKVNITSRGLRKCSGNIENKRGFRKTLLSDLSHVVKYISHFDFVPNNNK